MNMQIIKQYIQKYKEQFEFVHKEEIYKWRAVKCFQDNWNIDSKEFYFMLGKSLKRTMNLLSSNNYYPRGVLLENSEVSPKEVRSLFIGLFNENVDLMSRIKNFRKDFIELNKNNFTNPHHDQDDRAIMVYLALRFPERYFLYKFRMFKFFALKVDYPYLPIAGRIENVTQFTNMCNLIKSELRKDQELLKKHKDRIKDDCYFDEDFNILTQDFIYATVRHLDNKDVEIISEKEKREINVTEINSEDLDIGFEDIDFTPRTTNYDQKERENKKIGDLGELWVKEYEEKKLKKIGKKKYLKKLDHTSVNKGDGLGYDIFSCDENGDDMYIEVKTTKNNSYTTFFITRNELARSQKYPDKFYLYRVYNYNEKTNDADLLIIKGDLSKLCNTPVNYKVKLR